MIKTNPINANSTSFTIRMREQLMQNLIGTNREMFDELIEQTVDDELEIELTAQIENEETRALARNLIADKYRNDLYQAAKETVASQTFQITLARLSVVN